MKIALIGATGYTGSKILAEALDRGHEVTAIGRENKNLPTHPKLTAKSANVTNDAAIRAAVTGHDVVISAFNPGKDETGHGTRSIVAAVKHAGVKRLVVVGGAGSLEVEPGKRLVDQPDFPAQWKAGAQKTSEFLDLLRSEPDLNWTFVSPAAMLSPGDRSGKYRIGGDQLLTDAKGESRITTSDYAVALMDEVEKPQHHRRRFSVAY
jgi:putative NADH-flavin reductase